jgi:uncharacterized phage protein (TIGR02220 family)
MAEGKKSFMLYSDMINVFEKLPNEKAGELIKHIFRYVNDQNPETDDLLLGVAFEPIKSKLKIDLKKWEEKCEINQKNAFKRWEEKNNPALNALPVDAVACDGIKKDAKDADIDKDIDIRYIIGFLNSVLGSQYREKSKTTAGHISARLKEGFTVDQFKQVIQTKYAQWHDDPKMKIFLRPETLFGNKFEGYLNESKLMEDKKQEPKFEPDPNYHIHYIKNYGREKYKAMCEKHGVEPVELGGPLDVQ